MVRLIHSYSFPIRDRFPTEHPQCGGEDRGTHQLSQGQSGGPAPSLHCLLPWSPPKTPLLAGRSRLCLGMRKCRQGKSAVISWGREACPPRGLPPTSATSQIPSPGRRHRTQPSPVHTSKPRPISLPGFITRHQMGPSLPLPLILRVTFTKRGIFFLPKSYPISPFPGCIPPGPLQPCSTALSTGFGKVSGCTTTRRCWQRRLIATAFIPSSSSTRPAAGQAPTPGGSSSMPCGTWMGACGKWAPGESWCHPRGTWWDLKGIHAQPVPRQAVCGAGLPRGGVPPSLPCLGDNTVDLRGGHRTLCPPARCQRGQAGRTAWCGGDPGGVPHPLQHREVGAWCCPPGYRGSRSGAERVPPSPTSESLP